MNIKLNDLFENDAKEYQSKPIMAAKYKPGMENGFIICFACCTYEAFKFFETYEEAIKFYNEKPVQKIVLDGIESTVECEYFAPAPILYTERAAVDKNMEKCFLEDESDKYEWMQLLPDTWIIVEYDGTVRTWEEKSSEVPFLSTQYICR